MQKSQGNYTKCSHKLNNIVMQNLDHMKFSKHWMQRLYISYESFLKKYQVLIKKNKWGLSHKTGVSHFRCFLVHLKYKHLPQSP